jgi:predicted ArsR family transcriptional regulator
MHANTVRFHLEALAEQGLVERDVATPVGPGRPALVFRLRRGMDPAGPRNYRLLAAVLVDQLAAEPDAPARAVRAGRAWGSRLIGPVGDRAPSARRSADQIVDLLDDIGFAPEHPKSKDWRSVPLRHCPFLDLVDNRTDVICPIHLGLIQGAAEALGGRTRVDGLEPFVEPGMCLAHLSDARAPAGGSADGGNSGTRSRS